MQSFRVLTSKNSLIVSLCLLYHCYNGYTSQVQNINKSIYTKWYKCIIWPILKFYYTFSSWNPPWNPTPCWVQDNPVFLDQSYPSPTDKFWTTQTEGLIQIKTRIGFPDLICFQIPSFPFEQPIFKIWSNPITKIRSAYLWTTGPETSDAPTPAMRWLNACEETTQRRRYVMP